MIPKTPMISVELYIATKMILRAKMEMYSAIHKNLYTIYMFYTAKKFSCISWFFNYQ